MGYVAPFSTFLRLSADIAGEQVFITDAIKESPVFKRNQQKLIEEFTCLQGLLNKYSVPFFSPRYAGHMCFETSLPAIIGWVSTILFNPNNVSVWFVG